MSYLTTDVSPAVRQRILDELVVSPQPTDPRFANANIGPIYVFYAQKEEDTIRFVLPLHFPVCCLSEVGGGVLRAQQHVRSVLTFHGVLRQAQQEVADDVLNTFRTLASRGYLLALHCGFGKTVIALWLASRLQLRVCILVHLRQIREQWKEAIRTFLHQEAREITSRDLQSTQIGKENDWFADTDFLIVNPQLLATVSPLTHMMHAVGLLICDEIDTLCTRVFSQALLRIRPQFVIGLTATPQRADGMHRILPHFLGDKQTIRYSRHPFVVYKIETRFCGQNRSRFSGVLDYTFLQQSLMYNNERNALFVDLVHRLYQADRNVLVFTREVAHCQILARDIGKVVGAENVAISCGSTRIDSECFRRVHVATMGKLGRGFDEKRYGTLVLCSSIKNVEQLIGRIFRCTRRQPLMVDVVDNNSIMRRHWEHRLEWYVSRGADIRYIAPDSSPVFS